MEAKPFLHELISLRPGNDLYQGWLDYVLSFDDDAINEIVKNGLKHQALALRSLVRELIAGQPVSASLVKKLDRIVIATNRSADALR